MIKSVPEWQLVGQAASRTLIVSISMFTGGARVARGQRWADGHGKCSRPAASCFRDEYGLESRADWYVSINFTCWINSSLIIFGRWLKYNIREEFVYSWEYILTRVSTSRLHYLLTSSVCFDGREEGRDEGGDSAADEVEVEWEMSQMEENKRATWWWTIEKNGESERQTPAMINGMHQAVIIANCKAIQLMAWRMDEKGWREGMRRSLLVSQRKRNSSIH